MKANVRATADLSFQVEAETEEDDGDCLRAAQGNRFLRRAVDFDEMRSN